MRVNVKNILRAPVYERAAIAAVQTRVCLSDSADSADRVAGMTRSYNVAIVS